MGQAVTDAATWYTQADWIGVHATPHTSLIIESWMEKKGKGKNNFIVDWNVPLINGRVLRAKTVNWPRLFLLPNSPLCQEGETPRQRLLMLLSKYPQPRGTETKYANTVAFFDNDVDRFRLRKLKTG
jgi:hypothetical protein